MLSYNCSQSIMKLSSRTFSLEGFRNRTINQTVYSTSPLFKNNSCTLELRSQATATLLDTKTVIFETKETNHTKPQVNNTGFGSLNVTTRNETVVSEEESKDSGWSVGNVTDKLLNGFTSSIVGRIALVVAAIIFFIVTCKLLKCLCSRK